ncbi:surface-adhesin E family protein [Ralstonia pseudosolanacearum]|uniref:surface-adhesin E family protein n=1 Tax=Ralstonia pseudosolanacearum TaxID=1310165 RepID=UPI003CEA3E4E
MLKKTLLFLAIPLALSTSISVRADDKYVALKGSDIPSGASVVTNDVSAPLGSDRLTRLIVNYDRPQPNPHGKPYQSVVMAIQLNCPKGVYAVIINNGFTEKWANGTGVFLQNLLPHMKAPVSGTVFDSVLKYHCAHA